MKITVKDIAANGIIAAVYVVLTLVTYPLSYMGVQCRIAEAMVLLCFFRKDYIVGLTLGCAIANLFSSVGLVDVAFGTAATFIALLGIMFCKHLIVACAMPIIANAFIIGLELFLFVGNEPYFLFVGTVALGEFVAIGIGYILFMVLKSNSQFLKLIRANQNLDFKF